MKKIFLFIITLTIANWAVAQQPKNPVKPEKDIVELKMPNSGKVNIRLMFRNGSICDPAGKEGLTLLTADMIAGSGTGSMTSTAIKELVYPWSAQMGSFTDKEVVIFSFEVPTKNLDEFYTKVVKGLLLTSSMDKNDFDRLLSNQKNYVEQIIRESSDEEYGKKYLEYALFGGSQYAQLKHGTVASVSAITLEDVKKHYKNYFRSDNVLIGLAGDYPSDFPAKLKKDIAQLPSTGPAVPKLTPPAMPSGINVDIISKPGALGSAISAGFPMNITRSNDEFAALMVANSWLGEHRKSYSRLYKKIREERSMNYGDYSYIEWYENGGSNMLPPPGVPRSNNYFSIWLRPVQTASSLKKQYPELADIKVGHAHYALRMALREMDALVNKGMSNEDFENTRGFLKSYSKLYIEVPSRKLGYLMDSRFYNRTDWISELDALLTKLTVQDVNNAMKKHWQTKNMEVVIITDESEVAPLSESLKSNTPSPMSYSNTLKSSLSADILAEDSIVANYPIQIKNLKVINTKETFMK